MTDEEICERKFSSVEEEVVCRLEKFVHYLAGKNVGPQLEYDDLVGELMLELAKGLKAYPDLPVEQLMAVLRKMMDNRISELKYKFYLTSRKDALYTISLSIEVGATDIKDVRPYSKEVAEGHPVEELIQEQGSDPADIYESKERVMAVRSQLSPSAKRVFDAIVKGNQQLAKLVWLSAIRSGYIFKSRAAKMRSWHVADALQMDEREVKRALKEIKTVYREVANGS